MYRFRYAIGYTVLAIIIVGLLGLNITTLPPGLSRGEESSAVTSSQITLDKNFLQTASAIDLPYHLLQKASLHLFGLGTLGVRLPSVVLAALSALFLFLTFRRWFQTNVALVMGFLIGISSWFHSFGRIGTPDVMLVFWTSLIIYLATLVSQGTKRFLVWKALIMVCVGLSLYSPYMIYVFLAAAIAAYVQPHLRFMVHDERISFFIGFILFVGLWVPLGWDIWHNPEIIKTLLGVSHQIPDPLQFGSNLLIGISNLINPTQYTIGIIMTPLVSAPIVALAVLGLIRLFRQFHAVRSHVLLIWLAVLLPVIGFDAQNKLTMLFVPVFLLGAIGLQALFEYWYGLFPYNPYARIFGLIPLGILMLSIMQFNYQRYFVAIPYAASTPQIYDLDPLLLHGAITSPKFNNQGVTVVVPAGQVPLYSINMGQFKKLTVVEPKQFMPNSNPNFVIAESSMGDLSSQQLAQMTGANLKLVVNNYKNDSLRFRVFNR